MDEGLVEQLVAKLEQSGETGESGETSLNTMQ
jgi:hypothetical protein